LVWSGWGRLSIQATGNSATAAWPRVSQGSPMNYKNLQLVLKNEGYTDQCSFDVGNPPTEGYILNKVNELDWVVLYTDRGIVKTVAQFSTESDACDFFYKKLWDSYGRFFKR
jgi:hypothetical protein